MTWMDRTPSDFVSDTDTATNQSVTDAWVPAPANSVIEFEFEGSFEVAATSTGVGFGVTIPSGATLSGEQFVTGGASASTTVQTTELLNTSDTFSVPANSAVAAATGANRFRVKGRVVTGSTAGVIQLRVDTDAAAAVTVKKGVKRWYDAEIAA